MKQAVQIQSIDVLFAQSILGDQPPTTMDPLKASVFDAYFKSKEETLRYGLSIWGP